MSLFDSNKNLVSLTLAHPFLTICSGCMQIEVIVSTPWVCKSSVSQRPGLKSRCLDSACRPDNMTLTSIPFSRLAPHHHWTRQPKTPSGLPHAPMRTCAIIAFRMSPLPGQHFLFKVEFLLSSAKAQLFKPAHTAPTATSCRSRSWCRGFLSASCPCRRPHPSRQRTSSSRPSCLR